jgi:nucleoid DNA-binding protein
MKEAIKVKAVREKVTKAQLPNVLSQISGVDKDDAKLVLDALDRIITGSLLKNSIGEFSLFGKLKISRKEVPAKPARMGRNPATGEQIKLKAKPKSTKIKIIPLKGLKDAVL